MIDFLIFFAYGMGVISGAGILVLVVKFKFPEIWNKQPVSITEDVQRCEWPTGCVLEAVMAAIDFGFDKPAVRYFCKAHGEKYQKTDEDNIITENLKLQGVAE